MARAAVAAGASVLNDVSCSLVEVAGELGVGYVAMHRQGDATDDAGEPDLRRRRRRGERLPGRRRRAPRAAGVSALWLDPGIGFGKTVEHNLHAAGPRSGTSSGSRAGTTRACWSAPAESGSSRTWDASELEVGRASRGLDRHRGLGPARTVPRWCVYTTRAAAVQLRDLLMREPVEEVVA